MLQSVQSGVYDIFCELHNLNYMIIELLGFQVIEILIILN